MARVRALPIYDKQSQFRKSRAKLKAFIGGRGTGKTHIGAQDVLLTAKNEDPWVCVSPDNNVIRETTFPTFVAIAQKKRGST